MQVVVGRLRALNLETLSFMFEAVAADDSLTEEATLSFEHKEALVQCNECNNTWTISPKDLNAGSKQLLHYSGVVEGMDLTCPECDSSDYSIQEGRELFISRIEAEKRE